MVGEADNGEEAVALVKREKPHIALLDIGMRPVNGIVAMKRILKECEGTRVIILTVYDNDAYLDAARQTGASGYILKTATSEQLQLAVRVVAAGGVYFSADVSQRLMRREQGVYTVDGHIVDALTTNELEALSYAAKGLSNKEIARVLHVSCRSIQTRLAHVYDKLRAHSRTEAIQIAVRERWIDLTADEIVVTTDTPGDE